MEPFLFAVVCIAALVIFDILAIKYGADSRDRFRPSDWEPSSHRGF